MGFFLCNRGSNSLVIIGSHAHDIDSCESPDVYVCSLTNFIGQCGKISFYLLQCWIFKNLSIICRLRTWKGFCTVHWHHNVNQNVNNCSHGKWLGFKVCKFDPHMLQIPAKPFCGISLDYISWLKLFADSVSFITFLKRF